MSTTRKLLLMLALLANGRLAAMFEWPYGLDEEQP